MCRMKDYQIHTRILPNNQTGNRIKIQQCWNYSGMGINSGTIDVVRMYTIRGRVGGKDRLMGRKQYKDGIWDYRGGGGGGRTQ